MTTATSQKPGPGSPESHRFLSLDILKTVGVLYLILLHQSVWIFTGYEGVVSSIQLPGGVVFLTAITAFGLPVLGFQIPLLAGATFAISTDRGRRSFGYAGRRALFLIACGFALNAVTWGWNYIWDWDVLPFIGLSMILGFPLLRYLPRKAFGPAAVFLIAVCAAFSNRFPFPAWHENYLYHIVFGDLSAESYWPLLPWFGFFVGGMAAGRVLTSRQTKPLMAMMTAGVTLAVLSVATGSYTSPSAADELMWGPTIFSPAPLHFLGMLGIAWILVSGVELILRVRPPLAAWFQRRRILVLGKTILWSYMLSLVLGYLLTEPLKGFVPARFPDALLALGTLVCLQVVCCYGTGALILRKVSDRSSIV